jgi:hypothetical protein
MEREAQLAATKLRAANASDIEQMLLADVFEDIRTLCDLLTMLHLIQHEAEVEIRRNPVKGNAPFPLHFAQVIMDGQFFESEDKLIGFGSATRRAQEMEINIAEFLPRYEIWLYHLSAAKYLGRLARKTFSVHEEEDPMVQYGLVGILSEQLDCYLPLELRQQRVSLRKMIPVKMKEKALGYKGRAPHKISMIAADAGARRDYKNLLR